MDKYIQIFKDFILYDKEFVDDIIERFYKEVQQVGELLAKQSERFYGANKEELIEFFDFLSGNGFEVMDEEPAFPWDIHTVKVIPIYREDIIENEKEEEEKSVVYVETTVSSTVLSYTSTETYEGYYSECEEYVAPRKIRFCICRRMELPRLVSTSGRGCIRVPRPP